MVPALTYFAARATAKAARPISARSSASMAADDKASSRPPKESPTGLSDRGEARRLKYLRKCILKGILAPFGNICYYNPRRETVARRLPVRTMSMLSSNSTSM